MGQQKMSDLKILGIALLVAAVPISALWVFAVYQDKIELYQIKRSEGSLYQQGIELGEEGKHKDAIPIFEKIKKADPNYKDINEKIAEYGNILEIQVGEKQKKLEEQKRLDEQSRIEEAKEKLEKALSSRKFFDELIKKEVVYRYDVDMGELYIYEEAWELMTIDAKMGLAYQFMQFRKAATGSDRMNVYGARSGRKLASDHWDSVKVY